MVNPFEPQFGPEIYELLAQYYHGLGNSALPVLAMRRLSLGLEIIASWVCERGYADLATTAEPKG